MASSRSGWLAYGFGTAATVLQVQQVMAPRLLKLSRGGFAAAEEFDGMVFEKALGIVESAKPRRLRRYSAMAHRGQRCAEGCPGTRKRKSQAAGG